MDTREIISLNEQLTDRSPKEIIEFAFKKFGQSKVILASSLSIEDQVLYDHFIKINKEARVFFLDTGRHFQSTYDLLQATIERYCSKIEIYAPNTNDLETMIQEHGPNSFYENVDLRKKCCEIRKTQPLRRVLKTVNAWVCGLRTEQSPTRKHVNVVEWDDLHGIVKLNPLAKWKEKEVWDYIYANALPFNRLYKSGFKSIGCEPCTRAVKEGDDVRAGRWWWENSASKECGLHARK